MSFGAALARSVRIGGALASMLAVTASAPAAPATPALRLLDWVPNGSVFGVTRFGKRMVVGGSFTKIGPRTGQAAVVDRATGALDPGAFPEFAGGAVDTIVPDGAGGWFVGGLFRYAGGLPRGGLAHVLADGSIDPRFEASTAQVESGSDVEPGEVNELVLSGSTLYAGGRFNRVGGLTRNGLAALDPVSGAVTAWDPKTDGDIRVFAVSGNTVYAAGYFRKIGGADRNGLAALDARSGQATAWNPDPDETVASLAVGSGVVYVGGFFTTIGGASRRYLAAVDQTTGAATDWAPVAAQPIWALAAAGSTVYAAGLSSRGASQQSSVAALSVADGSASWKVDGDGIVLTLIPTRGSLFVSGGFQELGARARDGAAELAAADGSISSWAPQPDLFVIEGHGPGAVRALGIASDRIAIGGDFAGVGGVPRHGLAAVDPSTGKPSSWQPVLDGDVSALVGDASHLYVVGRFRRFDGRPRNGAAALDGRLRLLPWAPPPLHPPGLGNYVALLDDKVIVTGYFDGVTRVAYHGSMAAFDKRTGRLLDWGLEHRGGGGVGELVIADGHVYGADYNGSVVAIDPTTGGARGFVHNSGTGLIDAAAVSGRTLFLGGAMEAVDFRFRTRLAAVDVKTKKLLPWRPIADDTVRALATKRGVVYVAGQFRHVDGTARTGLAAVDAGSGRLLPWNPDLSGYARGLTSYGSGFAVTGEFLSVGAHAQPFVAFFAN